MLRRIINIDTEKCNGCGLCASTCHEGAIAMVEGKAKLMRDDYCDGLGDCLPVCPTGAITFIEKDTLAYDEEAVKENMRKKQGGSVAAFGCPGSASREISHGCPGSAAREITHNSAPKEISHNSVPKEIPHGCPGSAAREITHNSAPKEISHSSAPTEVSHGCPGSAPKEITHNSAPTGAPHSCPGSAQREINHSDATENTYSVKEESQLRNWPVQIKLAPVKSSYFDGARLLIAADCTAYAYASFHKDFIKGKVTLIGCPKLDSVDYSRKLSEIIANNDIKSVEIVRMEVPCCGGLEMAAKNALMASGKFIPWSVVTISVDGNILD